LVLNEKRNGKLGPLKHYQRTIQGGSHVGANPHKKQFRKKPQDEFRVRGWKLGGRPRVCRRTIYKKKAEIGEMGKKGVVGGHLGVIPQTRIGKEKGSEPDSSK